MMVTPELVPFTRGALLRDAAPAGAILVPLHYRGQVVAHSLVDEDRADEVLRETWRARISHGLVYAGRYVGTKDQRELVSLHRVICPVADGFMVDHINRDTLDNRAANLRAATAAENARNKGSWGAVGFKGVSMSAERGSARRARFMAVIWHNYTRHYLGRFETAEAAARAYDAKARELFGDFAVLNFPDVEVGA